MRIAFDLDGTLIDSTDHILGALNAALDDLGLGAIDADTCRGFVGHGLPPLVARTLDHLGAEPARHSALSARVMHHYTTRPCDPAQLYPGAVLALETLRAAGHHLSICTNKPFLAAIATLRDTGILDHFSLIVGGDSLPSRKPDPAMLRACAADLFVGDSEVDAETASAAGIPFLLFTEGYRKSPVDRLPHRASFAHHDALPALV